MGLQRYGQIFFSHNQKFKTPNLILTTKYQFLQSMNDWKT